MLWIFAIDPGPEKSGIVYYIEETGSLNHGAVENNYDVLKHLEDFQHLSNPHIVIEDVSHFGMPAGKSLFDTAKWIGRFTQKWYTLTRQEPVLIKRPTIKSVICNSTKAKDANVRQALIDRFPATGGGKTPQIGTKTSPGPLLNVKSHTWSALAVAITYLETKEET